MKHITHKTKSKDILDIFKGIDNRGVTIFDCGRKQTKKALLGMEKKLSRYDRHAMNVFFATSGTQGSIICKTKPKVKKNKLIFEIF